MHKLSLKGLRPYFAEIPYYLWGQVNYDSYGDCRFPTDREWTSFELTNRDTHDHVEIDRDDDTWIVDGQDPVAARTAMFLCARSDGHAEVNLRGKIGEWEHETALRRTEPVAQEFARAELKPFDSHLFWGSWKWIGWFATEFTWVGRWIMHSVVCNDTRAVFLCIDWLKGGTYSPEQSAALRYALHRLTGESFDTDKQWIRWYEGSWLSRGHNAQYPEPDIEAWLAELKAEYGDGS